MLQMNDLENKNGPIALMLEDYLRCKQRGFHLDCQGVSLR